MTDSTFEGLADSLLDALEDAVDDHVDSQRQGGVLTIDGEEGTWVVNKHAPTRQVWLSSPKSGARHFAFDAASGLWSDTRGGNDLVTTLSLELGVALAWSAP